MITYYNINMKTFVWRECRKIFLEEIFSHSRKLFSKYLHKILNLTQPRKQYSRTYAGRLLQKPWKSTVHCQLTSAWSEKFLYTLKTISCYAARCDNQYVFNRCTRSSITDIILPKFHLDVAKKSFYYHGACTSNSLPTNIKILPPKERFKAISDFFPQVIFQNIFNSISNFYENAITFLSF